jgi:hypothetical protein
MRDHPEIGRNDPCPCGSGRKYKKCHGPKDGDEAIGVTTNNPLSQDQTVAPLLPTLILIPNELTPSQRSE